MDDTAHTAAAPEEPERASSRNRWIVIGAVIAALAVAGIIGAVLLVSSDDASDDAAAQIGWMQDGCQQWADGYQGASGPDDDWCNSMAGWMNGRTGDASMMDRRQMMGPMMWQSADNMRATCEQWMAEAPQGVPTDADTSAWCEQMTDWMDQHMGDWDSWMTNGPR